VARVTGGFYLAFILASVLASTLEHIGLGTAPQVYQAIAANAWLFRLGPVSALTSAYLFLLAAWALYVLLRPTSIWRCSSYCTSTPEPRTVPLPGGSDHALVPSRPLARTTDLPVGRHLAVAYRLSLAVAVLIGGVSATRLASGPTGLQGPDSTLAAGMATSTTGILA
jgi:Domain of unknown function (DUF4386)